MIIEDISPHINELLRCAAQDGASDLHICTNSLPILRQRGELVCIANHDEKYRFTADELEFFAQSFLLTSSQQKEHFSKVGDADASYTISTASGRTIHCRVNIFQDMRGISLAFRLLPSNIPSMDKLRLPESVRKLRHLPHGLVLVTGATGNGKSTTIASLLDAINEERAAHIITIEQPVEYRFTMKRSLISQREVGNLSNGCDTFLSGLRSALRQDPDIILIGEMRDAETISTALAAAETGHLVFATLHAGNVMEAIDRLVQYFPAERHSEIRNSFANSFRGLIAQKLLPSSSGDRVAAFEILLPTDAIKHIIREGQSFRLRDYMHLRDGMQTMDESLQGLKNKHLI